MCSALAPRARKRRGLPPRHRRWWSYSAASPHQYVCGTDALNHGLEGIVAQQHDCKRRSSDQTVSYFCYVESPVGICSPAIATVVACEFGLISMAISGSSPSWRRRRSNSQHRRSCGDRLTVDDVAALLALTNFEIARHWEEVLWPLGTPLLASLLNLSGQIVPSDAWPSAT